MKNTSEKMQSTFFLKIVFAILISAIPFLGAVSENAGFFLMLAVFAEHFARFRVNPCADHLVNAELLTDSFK